MECFYRKSIPKNQKGRKLVTASGPSMKQPINPKKSVRIMITHNLGMRSDYSAIRARQPKKDCRIMYNSTLTDAMPSWPTHHNTKCLILLTTLVPTADALQCPPPCVTPTAELFRHKIVMKKNNQTDEMSMIRKIK